MKYIEILKRFCSTFENKNKLRTTLKLFINLNLHSFALLIMDSIITIISTSINWSLAQFKISV